MKIFILALSILTFMQSCDSSEQNVEAERQKNEKINADMLRKSDSLLEVNLIGTWGMNYKQRIDSANKSNYNIRIKKDIKKDIERQKEAEIALKKKYGQYAWNIYQKHKNWGIEVCNKLVKHQSWIGMDYDMLVVSRGKPNSVNKSNYGGGDKWQCCWDDWTPSCFYMGDDNIITSYN